MHTYAEESALVGAKRLNSDRAPALLHNLLDNGQTEANTVVVQASSTLELAESSEELWKILALNADTRILHMQDEQVLRLEPVACFDMNLATWSEL